MTMKVIFIIIVVLVIIAFALICTVMLGLMYHVHGSEKSLSHKNDNTDIENDCG